MKLMVLAVLITSSTCLDVNSTVKMATVVVQHFRSVCVYLLHGNETGKPCVAVAASLETHRFHGAQSVTQLLRVDACRIVNG
jgi:hypothetical protein